MEFIDFTNQNQLFIDAMLEQLETNPQKNNVINYIANNRHLPHIQYPLTTIYFNKRL